jgi:hypothetical protein
MGSGSVPSNYLPTQEHWDKSGQYPYQSLASLCPSEASSTSMNGSHAEGGVDMDHGVRRMQGLPKVRTLITPYVT